MTCRRPLRDEFQTCPYQNTALLLLKSQSTVKVKKRHTWFGSKAVRLCVTETPHADLASRCERSQQTQHTHCNTLRLLCNVCMSNRLQIQNYCFNNKIYIVQRDIFVAFQTAVCGHVS
jgi:hypothetical protein